MERMQKESRVDSKKEAKATERLKAEARLESAREAKALKVEKEARRLAARRDQIARDTQLAEESLRPPERVQPPPARRVRPSTESIELEPLMETRRVTLPPAEPPRRLVDARRVRERGPKKTTQTSRLQEMQEVEMMDLHSGMYSGRPHPGTDGVHIRSDLGKSTSLKGIAGELHSRD